MVVTMVVPVVGVPFINSTRCEKVVNLEQKTPVKVLICIDTKTFDAPYCDTFVCKESWVILSSSETSRRCAVKKMIKIHFVKSTFFKGKIQARAEEGMLESVKKWKLHSQSQGHLQSKARKIPVLEP